MYKLKIVMACASCASVQQTDKTLIKRLVKCEWRQTAKCIRHAIHIVILQILLVGDLLHFANRQSIKRRREILST